MRNRGHWTTTRQDAMCYAIMTKIAKERASCSTSVSKLIVKYANRFPKGLKQYYADKLLLIYIKRIHHSIDR